MTIQIKSIESHADAEQPEVNLFFRGEHGLARPSTESDGASFPPLPSKTLTFGLALVAVGTVSMAVVPIRLVQMSLSIATSIAVESPAARYQRLRAGIAAAGIPMLSDDELRKEIESRTGQKDS